MFYVKFVVKIKIHIFLFNNFLSKIVRFMR